MLLTMDRSRPITLANAAHTGRPTVWLLVIFIYALLLPREVRLSAGDLVFFADRLVAIAALPLIISAFANRALRITLCDTLLGLGSLFIFVSMSYHYGITSGLERGGALALDTAMAYFIGRYSVRNMAEFRTVMILIVFGLLIAGGSMALESIRGAPIVKPIFAGIFGPLPYYDAGLEITGQTLQSEYRLGLLRSSGPFSHPILGGLILCSILPIYLIGGIRKWPRIAGTIAALLSFFSLSSAALIGLFLGFVMIFYDWLQSRTMLLSWKTAIIFTSVIMLLLQVLTQSGVFSFIVRYLTLSAATGNYRMLIYEFGFATALNNPIFGIGFAGYDRPAWMVNATVDSHWLLLALRHGFPTALLFFALAIVSINMVAKAAGRSRGQDALFYKSIAILLFLLTFLGFTVAYFGGANSWYLAFTGAAVSLALSDTAQRRAQLPNVVRPSHSGVTSTHSPAGALPLPKDRPPEHVRSYTA
ncbi:hypothetical protein HME9302_00882 [Alteripontixanthobacter maritimus]|uniref:O-antigen ligase domain-containing protein n=1 Tax=Alteripontixanthobacter maritimus TaxID=2161824 RepID=A0A369Q5J3_9SPHN|nr:O-antigen ligase family protein [Alteripontixanthobacter maritimus]RDC59690.1 hypothetical protein HME9302_00882 [Alteripontixanthobacter maritimus]